ncbi:hypothetical protein ACOME3_001450 [Neoechinorhynchus agilis]
MQSRKESTQHSLIQRFAIPDRGCSEMLKYKAFREGEINMNNRARYNYNNNKILKFEQSYFRDGSNNCPKKPEPFIDAAYFEKAVQAFEAINLAQEKFMDSIKS